MQPLKAASPIWVTPSGTSMDLKEMAIGKGVALDAAQGLRQGDLLQMDAFAEGHPADPLHPSGKFTCRRVFLW